MAFAANPDPAIAAPILRRLSGEASRRARVNDAATSEWTLHKARAAALRTSALGSSNDLAIRLYASSPPSSARSTKAAARSEELALFKLLAKPDPADVSIWSPVSMVSGAPLAGL